MFYERAKMAFLAGAWAWIAADAAIEQGWLFFVFPVVAALALLAADYTGEALAKAIYRRVTRRQDQEMVCSIPDDGSGQRVVIHTDFTDPDNPVSRLIETEKE